MLPVVYEELRLLARRKMAGEKPGQTLQPTALVHEAYLRLIGAKDQKWENSRHFFSVAAEAMRRILIDIARKAMGSHLIIDSLDATPLRPMSTKGNCSG